MFCATFSLLDSGSPPTTHRQAGIRLSSANYPSSTIREGWSFRVGEVKYEVGPALSDSVKLFLHACQSGRGPFVARMRGGKCPPTTREDDHGAVPVVG